MNFIIYIVENPAETLIALMGAGIIALAVTLTIANTRR